MEDLIYERVIREAIYITENKTTIRETAKAIGICKSTVHKDLTQRLPYYHPTLYKDVRNLLNFNLSVRHIRGGEARAKKLRKFKN
ncbi:MAG: sporulation transcriptional regulator SpoIIID [Clostridia bacterium]